MGGSRISIYSKENEMDEKKRAELLDDKVKALEAPQRLTVEKNPDPKDAEKWSSFAGRLMRGE